MSSRGKEEAHPRRGEERFPRTKNTVKIGALLVCPSLVVPLMPVLSLSSVEESQYFFSRNAFNCLRYSVDNTFL